MCNLRLHVNYVYDIKMFRFSSIVSAVKDNFLKIEKSCAKCFPCAKC